MGREEGFSDKYMISMLIKTFNNYSASGIVFRQSIMKVSSKSLDYLQIFFSNSKVD